MGVMRHSLSAYDILSDDGRMLLRTDTTYTQKQMHEMESGDDERCAVYEIHRRKGCSGGRLQRRRERHLQICAGGGLSVEKVQLLQQLRSDAKHLGGEDLEANKDRAFRSLQSTANMHSDPDRHLPARASATWDSSH